MADKPPITYQQILAEQYEENAKDLLVFQKEYEEDELEEYNTGKHEKNELEDKEAFNKFHGDRNKPEFVIQPTAYGDTEGKSSIKHDINFRNNVLTLDSKFRGNSLRVVNEPQCDGSLEPYIIPATDSTYFLFKFHYPYKNILSVKLTSFELYNSFYTFSEARNNITFTIDSTTITIPQGNYATPADLVTEIQSLLDIAFGPGVYNIALHPRTHKIRFYSAIPFELRFPNTTELNVNPYNNGLGYNLGFIYRGYGAALTHNAENIPDVIQDTYVYLALNEWNLVSHQIYAQTSFNAFAKITLPGQKNTIVFDNNYTNSSSKEMTFHQPIDINQIYVQLYDAYGHQIDLQGGHMSLTLELKQVYDSSIYQKLLQL